MIVHPYVRPPAAPTVAFLDADARIVDEHGVVHDPDDCPPGLRVFASWEQVWLLVRDGVGEALCWNDEEIRFRHVTRPEETERWVRRPSDVYVLKLPFLVDELERNVREVARWRDWLARYGAAPGTTGAAAWSLLRARLDRKLSCGQGRRPPLLQTLGGRQEMGPAGRRSYNGPLALHDLPSAYARELGGLRYGGEWWPHPWLGSAPLDELAAQGLPVFVRARVSVPGRLLYGPLPKRPRRRMRSYLDATLNGCTYPVGGRLQSLWTWQEYDAALQAGCTGPVLEAWVHRSGRQPFLAWWEAVQEGRALRGMAGALAKLTGNALWGRFAMDLRATGKRGIRTRQGRRLVQRPLPRSTGPWPAHDLAETVSGRVRARLYPVLESAGEAGELVSAHTDGAWTAARFDPGAGWRLKEQASRLDLLTPQVLRYWPSPPHFGDPGPVVVFSGMPASLADEEFEERWAKHLATV